ncbi:hypothetical protein J4401_01970 [Candidatus Woesearchaeota archaeon]|nr:hypothetical protein [Candidatus Woesearchaeota archaeon]
MPEINFCPYCEAAQHKLLHCKEDIFFCKACSRFFRFSDISITCERCKGNLVKSDFDMPSGGTVFFCQKCKKTFPAKEIMGSV